MEKFKKVPTLSGLVSFSPQLHSVFGRQYRVIQIQDNKRQARRHGRREGRPEDLTGTATIGAEEHPQEERRPGGTLRAAALSRSFDGVARGPRGVARAPPARGRRADRAERRRQVDARQPPHGLRPPDLRDGRAARHGTSPAGARTGAAATVSPGRSSTATRSARSRCARTSRSRRSGSAPRAARGAAHGGRAARPARPRGRRGGAGRLRSRTATSGGSAWRARSRREPRFVLMDEPAAGLPEAEVPEFAAVVRSVRDDHGAGVLLIDHNMALIMDVCDRIQVLDQGRTLAAGNACGDPRQSRRRSRLSRRERRPRGGPA